MKTAGSGYCSHCCRHLNAYAGRAKGDRLVELRAFRHEGKPGAVCLGSGKRVGCPIWHRGTGAVQQ